jgi:hypothetical protein
LACSVEAEVSLSIRHWISAAIIERISLDLRIASALLRAPNHKSASNDLLCIPANIRAVIVQDDQREGL